MHLAGKLTSSTVGGAAVLLEAYPQAPPCHSAVSLMATRPRQRPTSLAELARAVVRGLVVHRPQMRASPPQGDPLTFLQAKFFQYTSSPNYTTVRLCPYHKCRVEAFCSPSRSPPAEPDVLQFHVQPDVGILKIVLLLPNLRKNTLASF